MRSESDHLTDSFAVVDVKHFGVEPCNLIASISIQFSTQFTKMYFRNRFISQATQSKAEKLRKGKKVVRSF